MRRLHVIMLAAALGLLTCSFFIFGKTDAATQQTFGIISWRAENYAPNDFAGKRLPIEGSLVQASFEAFRNGKVVDLGKHSVIWRVDSRAYAEAPGKKSISFKNNAFAGTGLTVQVLVQDLGIDQTITIPVATADVALRFPYDKNAVREKRISVFAMPYFFNIKTPSDLSYAWTIDGIAAQREGEGEDQLELIIPENTQSGTAHTVTLVASNKYNPLEVVSKNLVFTVQ